ncbi:MAG: radical SAM protein [Bacteroidales bacterium]|nr:radical SAM protein [Bacteroidales bacterium]HPE86252.1 radical SAM protein [Bacteroidales bacterium]
MKAKKLLLINPVSYHRKGFSVGKWGTETPLALGILAALTPPDFEVQILDEVHEKFHFTDADIVGITAFTITVARAYEIAALYREKNIPVVLGGIHASMVPDEAIHYVDSVVIGEAESVWEIVLNDFRAGNLKKVYRGEYTDLKNAPKPRIDLFRYKYQSSNIQTSRGCPMNCEFCSVTLFNGHKYRERPVEEVLDELALSHSFPQYFFVDDHIVNNSKKAQDRMIKLFRGMVDRKLQKPWFGQGSLNIADNEEVLKWAHRSGCYMILTGFETEKEEGLKGIGKQRNLRRGSGFYKKMINRMHKHRIAVLGAFIFGLDTDSEQDILDRAEYIKKSRVDAMQLSILTPLPGTKVFQRAVDENRLLYTNFPADWQKYHFIEVTMKPAKMTADRLKELMLQVNRSLYCKENLRRRMFKTLWRTRSFIAAYQAYSYNFTYGRMGLEEEIYQDTIKEGLNMNLEWKNRPRSKYLNRTDWIIALFYKTVWRRYAES